MTGVESDRTTGIESLSLAARAGLGSGASFWRTKSVAGIAQAMLTDGPHGVRAQPGAEDHLGIAPSASATCFPPAAGLAQSWSPELVHSIAAALAVEARASGVGVLLGPGINIRRDPRGGRNFEYFSEDPQLSAVLGTAWVNGLQSGGVGASVKHYAANNCETDRMRSNSVVDARTLREIYLWAFERVVKRATPWTVMASYNSVNGTLVSENRFLLTDVLRSEWGFDGAVLSDWGGVRDRVAAVRAGLDLQMPGGDASSDAEVVAAIESGELDVSVVDAAAAHVLTLLDRVADGREAHGSAPADLEAHHELAREAAARSIVLLKNDKGALPLERHLSLAVIGEFALTPRYQGGGSSHVNAFTVDVPLDEIERRSTGSVVFEPGTTAESRANAVLAADEADAAVLFLGLPDADESEGFDRKHIRLPDSQLDLLRAVAAVQPRTVVVLSHGGVVELSEVDELASAAIDGALLGQGGGQAMARVLFGEVDPSGRLSETVPERLCDSPSYLSFPGENSAVVYGEGVHVGYRWYDARELDVTYPFGHGLSYTRFEYDRVEAHVHDSGITVHVTVRNVGDRRGREVVQLYVAAASSPVVRPLRELKAFGSVEVDPGESTEIELNVTRADLAYWHTGAQQWIVSGGAYTLHVGSSSRDIRLSAVVDVLGDELHPTLTAEATMGEVMARPAAAALLTSLRPPADDAEVMNDTLGTDLSHVMNGVPLNRMRSLSGGQFPPELIDAVLRAANA